MKTSRLFNVGILFALIFTPAIALGSNYVNAPGNTCQPAFGNTTVDQDDFGMGNQSTTSSNSYICPIPFIPTSYVYNNVSSVTINVDDVSSTNEFSCYTFYNTPWGSEYWGSTRWACSTSGGCADPTTTFTGLNNINWSGGTLPSYVYSNGYVVWSNFGIKCTLPPATSSSWSGRSWIISYGFTN
jgi:hypothetical protein